MRKDSPTDHLRLKYLGANYLRHNLQVDSTEFLHCFLFGRDGIWNVSTFLPNMTPFAHSFLCTVNLIPKSFQKLSLGGLVGVRCLSSWWWWNQGTTKVQFWTHSNRGVSCCWASNFYVPAHISRPPAFREVPTVHLVLGRFASS